MTTMECTNKSWCLHCLIEYAIDLLAFVMFTVIMTGYLVYFSTFIVRESEGYYLITFCINLFIWLILWLSKFKYETIQNNKVWFIDFLNVSFGMSIIWNEFGIFNYFWNTVLYMVIMYTGLLLWRHIFRTCFISNFGTLYAYIICSLFVSGLFRIGFSFMGKMSEGGFIILGMLIFATLNCIKNNKFTTTCYFRRHRIKSTKIMSDIGGVPSKDAKVCIFKPTGKASDDLLRCEDMHCLAQVLNDHVVEISKYACMEVLIIVICFLKVIIRSTMMEKYVDYVVDDTLIAIMTFSGGVIMYFLWKYQKIVDISGFIMGCLTCICSIIVVFISPEWFNIGIPITIISIYQCFIILSIRDTGKDKTESSYIAASLFLSSTMFHEMIFYKTIKSFP